MNPVLLLVLLAVAIFALGMMHFLKVIRRQPYISGSECLAFTFFIAYLWMHASGFIAAIIVMLLFFAGAL